MISTPPHESQARVIFYIWCWLLTLDYINKAILCFFFIWFRCFSSILSSMLNTGQYFIIFQMTSSLFAVFSRNVNEWNNNLFDSLVVLFLAYCFHFGFWVGWVLMGRVKWLVYIVMIVSEWEGKQNKTKILCSFGHRICARSA